MATLKLISEPDQTVPEGAHDLAERLRAILRDSASDAAWNCWISHGSHGFSVRLQEARRVVPRGGSRDSAQVTYSGGGTPDFLLADITAWLEMARSAPSPSPLWPQRRRVDTSTRRSSRSRRG
jgi:hypothetical protein